MRKSANIILDVDTMDITENTGFTSVIDKLKKKIKNLKKSEANITKAIKRKANANNYTTPVLPVLSVSSDENVIITNNLTCPEINSCLSYSTEHTPKVAGSALNLPDWPLQDKINHFLLSKSVEKTKKKSLQKVKTKKSKIVHMSHPDVDKNPSYFRCHYPMESIFFFLGSFILSSILHMGVSHMTFISCTFLHIIAGFFDPAFLNTIFLATGETLNLLFTFVEKCQNYSYIFPSWIPKVRTRPRKIFWKWFQLIYKRVFPGFYSESSLLSNVYLRHARIHLIEDNSRVSSLIRHKIFKSGKQSTQRLNIRKIKEDINFNIPFYMVHSVPLIYPKLGKEKINLVLDTGSPVSILPEHLLNKFERNNNFVCTRFHHNKSFNSHSSTPLDILDYGVVLPLLFELQSGNIQPVFLQFYIERTDSHQGILGINAIKRIELYSGSSKDKHFFQVPSHFEPFIPASPISVNLDPFDPTLDVRIKNGLYSLETRSCQTFHDQACELSHDPRLPCLKPYSHIHRLFNIPRSAPPGHEQFGPVTVSVKNNRIIEQFGSEFVENYATLEYMSEVQQSRSLSVYRPNKSKDGRLRQLQIRDDSINSITDVYNDICDTEGVKNVNDTETVRSGDETQLNLEEKTFDEVKNSKGNYANVFFVDKNFTCMCKTSIKCNCLDLKPNQISMIKKNNNNKICLFLNHKDDGSLNYVIRIPDFKIIQDTPIGVFLLKSLISKNVGTIIVHSYNNALLTDFLCSLKKSVLNHPLNLLYCFIPEPIFINNLNQSNTIYKQNDYAASKCTISDSIIQEPEAFPPLNVKSLEIDTNCFIERSCPKEKDFLKTLIDTYVDAISQGPSDIGEIHKTEYKMDIDLLDEKSSLPLDLPYPTSDINKLACSRVVSTWLAAGIVERSQSRTHGSRLTVAKKHLSDTDFKQITDRLKKDNNIDIKERSEIFRQNPEVFTDSEIGKIFRVCLDARNINILTRPEFTCSPNPEQVISELISLGSEQPSKLVDLQPSPSSDLNQFLNENNIDDNKLYFSSLDIRAAHSSLILTDRASFLLNAILPDYTTIRFLRSPFGLKCVNSKFNFVLSDILKDLIKKRLVVIYSDDVLLISRGRLQHRLLLKEVLRLFQLNGIKLSLNKCACFVEKFTFLGFNFEKDGIRLTDERIKTITNLPKPKDLKSLQRFIGAFTYISKFIPDCQEHLLTITKLLNKNIPFIWSKPQELAFENLKLIVTSDMKLNYIDTKYPLSLYCDASQFAGGGVLYQEIPPENVKKPIAFFSRKFNPTQSRLYSSLELELLNIVDNLGRVQCFINQSPFPLKIVTDAKNILFLIKSQIAGPNPKLCRLASRLANYDVIYELNYEKPVNNPTFLMADYISRAYDPDNFQSISMAALRKVNKTDIVHNLTEGEKFTYEELINLVKLNPNWFINFPSPSKAEPNSDSPNPELPGDTVKPEININHIFYDFKDLTPLKILGSQRKDPELRKIIDNLETNYVSETRDEKGFYLVKNILHKMKNKELKICPENAVIVLPESIVADTIAYFHIMHGHLGVDRLSKIINELYYSRHLMKKVKLLVLGCATCQIAKIATNRLPPMSPSQPPLFPMQILSLDYFSTPPSNGNHFILIAVCRFSGYIFAQPCKREHHSEVIKLLKLIFSQAGPAQSVTSDNGSTLLKNKEVQKFLSQWGVHNISLSLAYSPLHNSRAERSVKYFRNLMRVFTENKEKTWIQHFERLIYIYNSTPRIFKLGQRAELVSPFQIFLRRPSRPLFINASLIKDPSARDYFMLEKQKIEELDIFISRFQRKQNDDFQNEHNLKSREPNFVAGDLVLLKNMTPPKQGEMPLKYLSPYKKMLYIVKFVSQAFCILINPVNGSILYQNSRFLKKYRPRGPLFDQLSDEMKQIMGDEFDPHNYKGNKNLIELIKKFQKDKPVSKSSLSSLSSNPVDILDSQSPPLTCPTTHAPTNINSYLKDEFCSSISSVPPATNSINSHVSDNLIPPNYEKKLEQIKPKNSIFKSLRNLPSRMARTFKK